LLEHLLLIARKRQYYGFGEWLRRHFGPLNADCSRKKSYCNLGPSWLVWSIWYCHGIGWYRVAFVPPPSHGYATGVFLSGSLLTLT
jgi:hypothetical protein